MEPMRTAKTISTGGAVRAPASPVPAGLIRLGGRQPLGAYVRDIWGRREFALTVPLGELRAQNMDSILGNVWHLLNPLLLIGVYYVVFDVILSVGDRGVENFVAFLSIGILTFFYTRKSLTAGAKSLVTNMPLVRSIRFPRAILPLAAVIKETVALGPALVAIASVVLLTGERPHPAWLLVVPAFAVQMTFNLGGALLLARLADHFRDVQQVLPYFFQIWLYVSGVFYSVEHYVQDPVQRAMFGLNPAYVYISMVRDAILDGAFAPGTWAIGVLWAVAALVGGGVYFRAREQDYGRG